MKKIDLGRLIGVDDDTINENDYRIVFTYRDNYILSTSFLEDVQILRDEHIPIQKMEYVEEDDYFNITLKRSDSYEFEIDEGDDCRDHCWLLLNEEEITPGIKIEITITKK